MFPADMIEDVCRHKIAIAQLLTSADESFGPLLVTKPSFAMRNSKEFSCLLSLLYQ